MENHTEFDNTINLNSRCLISQAKEPYNIHEYPEDPIKASILSLYPKLLHIFFMVEKTRSRSFVWERGVKLPVSLLRYNSQVRKPKAISRNVSGSVPIVVWLTNYQEPVIDDFPYQRRFSDQGCEVLSFQEFLGPKCQFKCLLGLSSFIGSYRYTLESVLKDLIPKTFGFFDASAFNTIMRIGLERRNVGKVWRAWCLHKRLTSSPSSNENHLFVSRSGGEVAFSVLKGTLCDSKKAKLRFLQIGHSVFTNPSKPPLPETYAADSQWVLSKAKKEMFEEKLVLNGSKPEISFIPRARSFGLNDNVRTGDAIGIALTSDRIPGYLMSYLLNIGRALTETFNRQVVIRPRGKSAHVKDKILENALSATLENRLIVETDETIMEHLNKVKVALVVGCPISRRLSNIIFDYLDVDVAVAGAVAGTVTDGPKEIPNFPLDDINGIIRFVAAELGRYNDSCNNQRLRKNSMISVVDDAVRSEISRFS